MFVGARAPPRADVVAWIGAISTQAWFERACEDRLEGTCEWLEELPTYKDWIQNDDEATASKHLWLDGPAGFGKTVLCAFTVSQLIRQGHKVLHFFCSSREPATQAPSAILRSWVDQMVKRDTGTLNLAHDRSVEKATQRATTTDLWHVLRQTLRKDPSYVLVIDGFDECLSQEEDSKYDTKDARIRFLEKLGEATDGTGCRVLLCCRKFEKLEEHWQAANKPGQSNVFTRHEISAGDNAHDTSLVSRDVIDEKLQNKSESAREHFSVKLSQRSGGMFLLIRLTGGQLDPADTEAEVQEVIDNVPPGLEGAFKMELEAIQGKKPKFKDLAINLLRWVSCAMEPLTIREIADALIVDINRTEGPFPADRLATIDEAYINRLGSVCGSLLKVVGGSETPLAERTLQFAHSSMAEYLAETKGDEAPGLMFNNANIFVDHDMLTRTCIRYLLYDDFGEGKVLTQPEIRELEKKRPFLAYAAHHWSKFLPISASSASYGGAQTPEIVP